MHVGPQPRSAGASPLTGVLLHHRVDLGIELPARYHDVASGGSRLSEQLFLYVRAEGHDGR